MTRREEFIETTKSLFGANARIITTDPFKAGEGVEFAIPINDLIIIDGHCGAQTILEHEGSTKYIIVSGNKFLFNNIEYATVYVIEEIPGKPTELYSVLSNAESLALHCKPNRNPILPIGGNTNFISSPEDFHLTRYVKTNQEGIYIRQDIALNITEKLGISIQDSRC